MVQALHRGARLRKPEGCPAAFYDGIMVPCWQADPAERPTFTQLRETLQRIKGEYADVGAVQEEAADA